MNSNTVTHTPHFFLYLSFIVVYQTFSFLLSVQTSFQRENVTKHHQWNMSNGSSMPRLDLQLAIPNGPSYDPPPGKALTSVIENVHEVGYLSSTYTSNQVYQYIDFF